MANQYINLYKNDPTAGQTDGSAISTDGTQLNPLEVSLDATTEESKKVKLAVRTESLYTASGDVTINDYNDTNDRWKFSLTENGTFSDMLTISDVSSINSIFYAQASSSSLESPSRDTSVKIQVKAKIAAV